MSSTSRTPSRTVLPIGAALAALEGYDLACYGVTVPSLLADGGIGASTATAGSVGALVAIGMLLGAATSAALTSRYGSKRLLVGGATLFSAGMLVCTVAPTFGLFGAARLLVGVGLGIVLPTVTAYVADLSAPERRSRSIGIMMSGYAAGALLAPLIGAAMLPGASWRWIYLIGAVPAVVLIPLAIRLLPEAPVSPAAASDGHRRELLGLRPLLAPGVRLVTILFWLISFCGLLLVFGISTWLPTIMQAAGYSLGSSLLQTAAMWVGAGVGMVAGGAVADRVGVKPVVAVAFLAGSASLLVMSARPALGFLFLLMFVSGLGFIGSQAMTNALNRHPLPGRTPGPRHRLGAGGRAARRDHRAVAGRGHPVLTALGGVELLPVRGAGRARRGPGRPGPVRPGPRRTHRGQPGTGPRIVDQWHATR